MEGGGQVGSKELSGVGGPGVGGEDETRLQLLQPLPGGLSRQRSPTGSDSFSLILALPRIRAVEAQLLVIGFRC